jgi:hypothetical protein
MRMTEMPHPPATVSGQTERPASNRHKLGVVRSREVRRSGKRGEAGRAVVRSHDHSGDRLRGPSGSDRRRGLAGSHGSSPASRLGLRIAGAMR